MNSHEEFDECAYILAPKNVRLGAKVETTYPFLVDLPIKGGLGSQFYCNLAVKWHFRYICKKGRDLNERRKRDFISSRICY